jgi:hypothetical protein
VVQSSDPELRLDSRAPGAAEQKGMLRIPLHAVEAGIEEHLPEFGAETHQMKVLDESYTEHTLVLKLSAPGGTTQMLKRPGKRTGEKSCHESTAIWVPRKTESDRSTVHFTGGDGYIDKTVTLRW